MHQVVCPVIISLLCSLWTTPVNLLYEQSLLELLYITKQVYCYVPLSSLDPLLSNVANMRLTSILANILVCYGLLIWFCFEFKGSPEPGKIWLNVAVHLHASILFFLFILIISATFWLYFCYFTILNIFLCFRKVKSIHIMFDYL